MEDVEVAQQRAAEFVGDRIAAQLRAAGLDGPGADLCADCADPIPAARREALPSAFRCVNCQAWAERVSRIQRAA